MCPIDVDDNLARRMDSTLRDFEEKLQRAKERGGGVGNDSSIKVLWVLGGAL